jgi:hypothetical protein
VSKPIASFSSKQYSGEENRGSGRNKKRKREEKEEGEVSEEEVSFSLEKGQSKSLKRDSGVKKLGARRESVSYFSWKLKKLADNIYSPKFCLSKEDKEKILDQFLIFLFKKEINNEYLAYIINNLSKLFKLQHFDQLSKKELTTLLPAEVIRLLGSSQSIQLANILNGLAQLGFDADNLGFSAADKRAIGGRIIEIIGDCKPQDLAIILLSLAKMGCNKSDLALNSEIKKFIKKNLREFSLIDLRELLFTRQIQDLLGDNSQADRYFIDEEQIKLIAARYQEKEKDPKESSRAKSTRVSKSQKDIFEYLNKIPGVTNAGLEYPVYEIGEAEVARVAITRTDIKFNYKYCDSENNEREAIFYLEYDGPSHFYKDKGQYHENPATTLRNKMLEEIVRRKNETNPDPDIRFIFLALPFYEIMPRIHLSSLNEEQIITMLQGKLLEDKLKSGQEELKTGVLGSQKKIIENEVIETKYGKGAAIQEELSVPRTSVAPFGINALSGYPGSPSLSGY